MRNRTCSLLFIFLCVFNICLASIIKIPPASVDDPPYKELVCTDQDKANISEIIITLAENGKVTLLLNQNHIKQLGAKINHVHPLKFLEAVFADAKLKTCMTPIFNDYFKRNGFMEGLGSSLQRESEKGKLDQYATDFAKALQLSQETVRNYFKSREWENFVRFLMQS